MHTLLSDGRKTRGCSCALHVAACIVMFSMVACAEDAQEPLRLITLADSFVADGRLSTKKQLPIVVFVSQQGCQFCEVLREQVLFPLMRAGQLQKTAIFRELSLDAGFTVVDVDGASVAGAEFAGRYGANVTPTLVFLDSDGKELADKRVGISNIEYYGFYLVKTIEAATAALDAGS